MPFTGFIADFLAMRTYRQQTGQDINSLQCGLQFVYHIFAFDGDSLPFGNFAFNSLFFSRSNADSRS